MTALPEEVEGAMAEGAELLTLQAPVRIESRRGRQRHRPVGPAPDHRRSGQAAAVPGPCTADAPEQRIPCDIVVVAIGQGIETQPFEESGVPDQAGRHRGVDCQRQSRTIDGVFAGGDCVTGPATVIRAIAAGKVAAANIDEYPGLPPRDHLRCGDPCPDPAGPCRPAAAST